MITDRALVGILSQSSSLALRKLPDLHGPTQEVLQDLPRLKELLAQAHEIRYFLPASRLLSADAKCSFEECSALTDMGVSLLAALRPVLLPGADIVANTEKLMKEFKQENVSTKMRRFKNLFAPVRLLSSNVSACLHSYA